MDISTYKVKKRLREYHDIKNSLKGKRKFMDSICEDCFAYNLSMGFSYSIVGAFPSYTDFRREIFAWKLTFAATVQSGCTTSEDVENLLSIMEKTDCTGYAVAATIRSRQDWMWPSDFEIITIYKKIVHRLQNDGVEGMTNIIEEIEEGERERDH